MKILHSVTGGNISLVNSGHMTQRTHKVVMKHHYGARYVSTLRTYKTLHTCPLAAPSVVLAAGAGAGVGAGAGAGAGGGCVRQYSVAASSDVVCSKASVACSTLKQTAFEITLCW